MTGKELAEALVRAAATVRSMGDIRSLELEIMPRATLVVRSPNAERQKRHRERNESNGRSVTDVTPTRNESNVEPVTKVTDKRNESNAQAQDPPFPPHTPPIPPESKNLPTPGISSLSLLLPDQPESVGTPRARARKHKARTALPEGVTASAAAWSNEQAGRLLAIGRDLLREDERFIAYHEAQGTLSANWKSHRTRWVMNAEDGYGAPRAQTTGLGMVTQIRRRDASEENTERQLRRVQQLELEAARRLANDRG